MIRRMDASKNGGDVVFRTAFTEDADLVQVFHGLAMGDPTRNGPVDFRLAGLQRRGNGDIWHVDQVLAFSTDECPPLLINGEDVGGNHGHPCAVRAEIPGHGLDCRSVGSLWQDEAGMAWTLLRVESADQLLMLSENIGDSLYAYDFVDHITGSLTGDAGVLTVRAQQGKVQLTPAIRHQRREAVGYCDGCWQAIGGYLADCEKAELREVYEVVNPATVAQALRDNRPASGYTSQPSLAVGEAMALCRNTYRIAADGTVLCEFHHELLQLVRLTHYLGEMHQERCDVFGGGVWRYIPKLRAFTAQGNRYDFSCPYNTTVGPMPEWETMTLDRWASLTSPPDRQIDFIRRADGSGVGFATGFLPCYDGAPEIRAQSITDGGEIVASRKTYPTFAGGKANTRSLPSVRGVAYRTYFPAADGNASAYQVDCDGSTYLYLDFFAPDAVELRRAVDPLHAVTPLECQHVTFRRQDGAILAQGKQGFAVLRVDAPHAHKRG